MKLKTINEAEIITLEEYSQEEYRDILIERNGYVLRQIHEYGDDYGGSHCSDERVVTYEEIIPERILVKEGHFCGVCIYTDYDYMNGGYTKYIDESVLFTDGHGAKSARSGFSFSNDDHSRWDYVTYYLMERDKAEKTDGRNN